MLKECGKASVLVYDEQVITENLKKNSKYRDDNAMECPEDIRKFTPVMTAQWKALLSDLVSTKVKEGTVLKVGAELMLEGSHYSWCTC